MSPQPFINQMNRATSETQKDMADEEGLRPILAWIKRLCDHVIVMLGGEGLEFVWNAESVIDPTVQRENLVAYVGAGKLLAVDSINHARRHMQARKMIGQPWTGWL